MKIAIKTCKWVKALAFAVLALPLAGYAVTVTQTVDSASSTTDWNTALWGSPADVPVSGTDYITSPGLRSAALTRIGAPDATAFVRFYGTSTAFAGDSLTLTGSTELLLKQTANEVAEANVILDGGSLRLSAGSSAQATVTGAVHVASESWIGVADLGTPVLTVESAITGTNLLHVGFGLSAGTLMLSGDLAGFSGTIELGGGDTAGTLDFGQNENLSDIVLGLRAGLSDNINLTKDMTFLTCNYGPANSLPVGTYTAEEANEALQLFSVTFVDNGGSITVLTAPYPAPQPPPPGIVYQVAAAGSSDSWNGPAIWGGETTVSTNDYFSTKTFGSGGNQVNYNIQGRVRALSSDDLFNGNSLTLINNTELLIKGSGGFTHTCANLILEGALVRYAPDSASLVTLAGSLTVSSNSVIGIENTGACTLTIDSALHGSGDLSLRAGRVTHTLALGGDLSDYTGSLSVGGGTSALILDLNQNYDLPDVDLVMENNTNRVHVLQLDDQAVKVNTFAFGASYLPTGSAYTAVQLDAFFGTTNQFSGAGGTLEVYEDPSIPTVSPVITSITADGTDVTLSWTDEGLGTYTIQRTFNLLVPAWNDVLSGLPAGLGTTNVTASGAAQEFYQLIGE